jgi:MerC mercury resistance protein
MISSTSSFLSRPGRLETLVPAADTMPVPIPLTETRPALDTMGATASLMCAVHCAIAALFIGVAPALSFFAAPWIDWAFFGISAVIGLAALVPGYRLHRMRRPLTLFALGMTLLLILRVLHVQASLSEMAVVIVAASSLITAHWINRGATHRCICGQDHSAHGHFGD